MPISSSMYPSPALWFAVPLWCLSQHPSVPLTESSAWVYPCWFPLALLQVPTRLDRRLFANSSGWLIQCPNFDLLLLILPDSFGNFPYRILLLPLSFHESPSTMRTILVFVPSKLFSWAFVIVQASQPYSRTDSQWTIWLWASWGLYFLIFFSLWKAAQVLSFPTLTFLLKIIR